MIVPWLVEEAASEAVAARLDELLAPTLSQMVRGEVSAALAVKTRRGDLARTDMDAQLASFDLWCDALTMCGLSSVDLAAATALVRRADVALRMPDAIHLACCRARGLSLLTRDRGMARAAVVLGVGCELLA